MKKFIVILLLLVLILSVPAAVFGAGTSNIIDEANLLTSEEEQHLNQMAWELISEYQIDVVILTVDSYRGKDITAFADDYYDDNGYGVGSQYSGVILVLSMSDRDWAISTCGDAIEALTDYGQSKLMDRVLPYLGDDEFYDGFRVYLQELDRYFEAYKEGNPIDRTKNYFLIIVVAILIGLLTGFITISVMKSGMKSIKPQSGASNYVTPGTYKLIKQQDIYLYSQTSKVKKAESSSGGSSTHRSSSGRSHGGSSGKF